MSKMAIALSIRAYSTRPWPFFLRNSFSVPLGRPSMGNPLYTFIPPFKWLWHKASDASEDGLSRVQYSAAAYHIQHLVLVFRAGTYVPRLSNVARLPVVPLPLRAGMFRTKHTQFRPRMQYPRQADLP